MALAAPNFHNAFVALPDTFVNVTAKGGQATVGEVTKLAVGFTFSVTVCLSESTQKPVVAVNLTVKVLALV